MRAFAQSVLPAVTATFLFVLLPGAFGADNAHVNAASPSEGDPAPVAAGEIPALRTRTSRTFLQPNGLRRAEFSAVSVNYRDARGRWQPIDNALVPR